MTRNELDSFIEENWDDPVPVLETIRHWLDRGDGVAIYRNEDLSSATFGHIKIVSYGGVEAQLEVGDAASPPTQLPDIGDQINWRYRLHGAYRAAA